MSANIQFFDWGFLNDIKYKHCLSYCTSRHIDIKRSSQCVKTGRGTKSSGESYGKLGLFICSFPKSFWLYDIAGSITKNTRKHDKSNIRPDSLFRRINGNLVIIEKVCVL